MGKKENRNAWPFNLLESIFKEDVADVYANNLEEAIGTLNEREQVVLRQRFIEGKTHQEIANEMGLKSRERIRQVEAKSIRKLQHPNRRNVIVFGRAEAPSTLAAASRSLADIRELIEQNKELKHQLIELEARLKIAETEVTLFKELKASEKDLNMFSAERFGVSKIGVRAYNVLMRHTNLRTFDDLVKFYREHGEEGFTALRGMGEKSARELVSVLHSMCPDRFEGKNL